MKHTTVIAHTNKGHRIFLEGLATHGWTGGMPYTVTFEPEQIVLQRTSSPAAPLASCLALDNLNGKRKVVSSKGGVIDLQSKKVTVWAQGSTQATIVHDRAKGRIIITRTTEEA